MPVIFLPYKKRPWICKFREPWSGRPRVRSFNSEQEALDFERVQRLIFEREKALVRRARYKGRQPERTLTVAELLSAYIEARQSLSTRTTAMQHLRSFADIYGHRKAHCISVDDVLAWMEIMRQRGAGAATVSRRAAILKGAWAWACRSRHLDSNALSVLRIPTVRSQRIDPPTLQEARRLYAVAAEHVQRVIALGMGMGPRIGPSELFRLRWLDVDLDSRLIRMPNARKGAEFEARSIPVRDDLLPLLRRWQQADAAAGVECVIHYRGRPVQSISRAWHNALRRAGIGRRLRPYDLRHAFASHALDHGADRKCVAEVMGHKNEGMLLQIYQHTLLRQRRRAVNAGPGLGIKIKKK